MSDDDVVVRVPLWVVVMVLTLVVGLLVSGLSWGVVVLVNSTL